MLLTGDGKDYSKGVGFYCTLERMQKRGWPVEILSEPNFVAGEYADGPKKTVNLLL